VKRSTSVPSRLRPDSRFSRWVQSAFAGSVPPETESIFAIEMPLPGFAGQDKERAHIKAWEGVIAAACGQFTDMGLNRILMGINPSFSPLPLASAYAALLASTVVSAALFSREETGHGDKIEIPIAAALMEGLVYNSMYIEKCPERYLSLREREIDRRRSAGEPLDMTYDEIQEYMDPFYRSYFCKDGRPVYVVASSHICHSHKTLEVMDLLEEVLEAGLPELEDWYLPTSKWPEGMDCALGLYPLTREWSDFVSKRMKEKFLEKTSFEWEALFGEAGVPVSAHRHTREWLNSEHPLATGLVHEITDPVIGKKRLAGPVAWLDSSAKLAATGAPAPKPDQHRNEILASLGKKDPGPEVTFTHGGYWLKGVKILDMTNVIAGPTVGNTLARFGAEVIKLDPIKPTYDPWNTILIGIQVLQGKQSILADIKSKKGKDIFRRLIQWADVITFNGPRRQLASLGIDPDSLKAINSKIILLRLDCWGGPRRGPCSDYVGYDDLVQAATGIMARFGGSLKTPEEHAHFGTIDVLTGFAGAFAVSTALYKRRKTGETDIARTSLCACGQLLQVPFTYDFKGRGPFNEASGPKVKGCGPLYRCYEAMDAWFFLAVGKKSAEDLEAVEELKGVSSLVDQALENFLSKRFKTREAAYWVEKLVQADIGAAKLASLSGLREKYSNDSKINIHADGPTFQFTRYDDHPCGHGIGIIAPCAIRPQYAALAIPAPAGKYGKETRVILAKLGYSPEEIETLLEEGVASESWSEQYLPD
jgi:crotonobetainyl-CoA:carnitine CoA-transferase CaiB-like acyl-CoA transferase